MNRSQDDQLDRLLADWANKTASSSGNCESLKSAISERLDADVSPTVKLASLQVSRNRWRLVATGLAATAAAAVLYVSIGAWQEHQWRNAVNEKLHQMAIGMDRDAGQHPFPGTTVSTDHQMRLWQEHHRVFGSQLVWIAERDGQTEIGLTNPSVHSNHEELITVRLILWSRPEGGGEWQEVQTFRVTAGREQLVEFDSIGSNSNLLEIWAYPLDKKRVSIDLRYQPSVPGVLPVEQSVLQRLGEDTKVCSFEKDGVEYQLNQVANLIIVNDLG